MLSVLFLLFVLVGTSYAAYLDLRTSEVPDSVSLIVGGGSILFYLYHSVTGPNTPWFSTENILLLAGTILFAAGVGVFLRLYRPLLTWVQNNYSILEGIPTGRIGPVMYADLGATGIMVLASLSFFVAYQQGGLAPVIQSVLAGSILFAVGWGMYLAGMWGGADAFVLGAVGYAFPYLPSGLVPVTPPVLPVPLSLLIMVFSVGAIYSVVYAVILAVRDGDAVTRFWTDLVAQRQRIGILVAGYIVASLAIGQLITVMAGIPQILVLQNAAVFLLMLIGLLILYQFLKVVEDDVMHAEIPVDELQPGDVLAGDLEKVRDHVDAGKIVGVTPEQVEYIRSQYETVEVRTGVRFIIAFPIAIILLVLLGDPLYVLATIL